MEGDGSDHGAAPTGSSPASAANKPSDDPPASRSALATEHFALRSVSSATISESGSRPALYFSALSLGGLFYESRRLVPLIRSGVVNTSKRALT